MTLIDEEGDRCLQHNFGFNSPANSELSRNESVAVRTRARTSLAELTRREEMSFAILPADVLSTSGRSLESPPLPMATSLKSALNCSRLTIKSPRRHLLRGSETSPP